MAEFSLARIHSYKHLLEERVEGGEVEAVDFLDALNQIERMINQFIKIADRIGTPNLYKDQKELMVMAADVLGLVEEGIYGREDTVSAVVSTQSKD